jgi:hypothetical protein
METVARISATWYAWGRNDAEGTSTDVFEFGKFYEAQRTSRGQSVQDAYKTFTKAFTKVDLGNAVRQEGVDRCACGCKYWENDRCIDCGGTEVAMDEHSAEIVRAFANREAMDEDGMADLDAIDNGGAS